MAAASAADESGESALREAFMLRWDVLDEAGAPGARGRIARPRFVTATRSHVAAGIAPAASGAAFRRLDRDGGGAVTHGEFRPAVEESYLGTGTEAPGDRLLGPPLPRG